MLRETVLTIGVVLVVGFGCRHRWTEGPDSSPGLERKAQRAAKRSAAVDSDCTKLTSMTLSVANTGQHMSYTVEVEGCGRTVVFEVTCDNGICTAEPR